MNNGGIRMYYRDKCIVVCEKPAGVLSEGDAADAMPSLLSAALKAEGMASPVVYPVHRLDRDTRGIMVYALTKNAAAALSQAFADHLAEKEYLALVHGVPEPREGEMKDLLYYDRTRNRSYPVKRLRKGVKDAALTYRVQSVDGEKGVSLVRVRLLTGRTHQIRVQFASRQMPLVGDRKYGAPATDGTGISLRAVALSFPHPETGAVMVFRDED